MIYHYDNLPQEAQKAQAPVGWDLPVLLSRDYGSSIMLAAICLNIGYYIGQQTNKGGSKNELAAGPNND